MYFPDIGLRIWLWIQSALGIALIYAGTLTDYGEALIAEAHAMWDAVFDVALPGSTSTIGDWMVLTGTSYFLTIVCAALLVKVIWLATKASWGFVSSLA